MGVSSSGALMDISCANALVSRLSIVSRLEMGSVLFQAESSVVKVKDCAMDGLLNRFASFSRSCVLVKSSNFSRSVRPVTMEEFNNRATANEEGKILTSSTTVQSSAFTNCWASGSEGGALAYKLNSGFIHMYDSEFNNCRASWGSAVYAKVPAFEMDRCTIHNFAADNSVVHFQNLDDPVIYESNILMNGNTFRNITVKSTDKDQPEGGGSGLVIRYPSEIELRSFTFDQCTLEKKGGGAVLLQAGTSAMTILFNGCTFTQTKAAEYGGAIAVQGSCTSLTIKSGTFSNNKGAQSDAGGFIYILNGVTTFTIEGTSFQDTDAARAGCIYASETVNSFTVNDCTVQSAGAREAAGPYCIEIAASVASISLTKLQLKQMPGGYGQMKLSNSFSGTKILMSECVFENFNTTYLFQLGTQANQWALEMSQCRFTQVVISGANLIQVASTDMKCNNLTVKGCTFQHISSAYALVLATSDSNACEFTSCEFNNVSTTNTQYRERVLSLTGFSTVTLQDTKFLSMTNRRGIVAVGKSQGTVSIKGLRFEGVSITGDDTTIIEPQIDVYGTISLFDNCQFISCTSLNAVIVRLNSQVAVTSCTFDSCSSPWGELKFLASRSMNLRNCSFKHITQQYPPVIFDGTTNGVNIQDVVFNDVTVQNTEMNLISCSGTFPITMNNVSFTSATFKNVITASGTTSLTTVNFTDCTVTNLLNCQGGSLSVQGCTFDGCTATGGSLIKLGDGESYVSPMSFSDCCFRGTSSGAYLNCPNYGTWMEVTFQLPLCFDKPENEAVIFNGMRPWENLSNHYQIFDCDSCESQPSLPFTASEAFTPSSVFTASNAFTASDTFIASDSVAPTTQQGDQAEKASLAAGVIACIVIVVIAIILVVIVLLILFVFRKRQQEATGSNDGQSEMTEENTETTTAMTSVDTWDAKVTEDNPIFTNDLPHETIFDFEESWT